MRTPGERAVDAILAVLAGAVFLILYAPVIICALFSVVEVNRGVINWPSATLAWYGRLLENQSIIDAVQATLIVGAGSVTAATVAAVVLALYVNWEGAIGRRAIELVVYMPFLLPPIVTGLALLIFFVNAGVDRSLLTVGIGHAVFILAIVYRLVSTRLQSLSRSLVEASADLGANGWQSLRYVLWPQLRPAVATGAILAFTLSFDETLISVFLAGDSTTLPLRLWAMMRVGFSPEINALITIVLVISIVLTIIVGRRLRPAGQEEME